MIKDFFQFEGYLPESRIKQRAFTVHEINKCIQKLKIGKSAGPDQISNEIFKYSGIVTCKAITKLFA
jgi:hypothetical protein